MNEDGSSRRNPLKFRKNNLGSTSKEFDTHHSNVIPVASKTQFTQVSFVVQNKPCLTSKQTASLERGWPFLFLRIVLD
jgi:hypothetical protein